MSRSGVLLLCFVFHVLMPNCEMTDDPIAADCEPLCQFELLEERWCALQKGCYEPQIKDNDALFIQCWQPCWRSSTNCLSLCRAEHGAIKQKCGQQCASSGDAYCPSFCFAYEVDQLVHGTSNQGGGSDRVKPPGTQPTQTDKPPTPTPQGPAVTAPPSDVKGATPGGEGGETTTDSTLE